MKSEGITACAAAIWHPALQGDLYLEVKCIQNGLETEMNYQRIGFYLFKGLSKIRKL